MDNEDRRPEFQTQSLDKVWNYEEVDFIEVPEGNSNSLVLFRFKKKTTANNEPSKHKPAA